eukprot:scaffold2648_cov60-Cyclotella_meneghiniana.AAC.2
MSVKLEYAITHHQCNDSRYCHSPIRELSLVVLGRLPHTGYLEHPPLLGRGRSLRSTEDFKTPCHPEVVTGMSLNISGVSGSRPAIDLYSIVDCSIGCVVVPYYSLGSLEKEPIVNHGHRWRSDGAQMGLRWGSDGAQMGLRTR